MGWSIGFDEKWQRDIGYGVPAYCDHPDCNEKIDRGLSYVCANEEPRGGDGCGLYFCGKHLGYGSEDNDNLRNCCERCAEGKEAFMPKPEHPEWLAFKATDPSWEKWRKEQKRAGGAE